MVRYAAFVAALNFLTPCYVHAMHLLRIQITCSGDNENAPNIKFNVCKLDNKCKIIPLTHITDFSQLETSEAKTVSTFLANAETILESMDKYPPSGKNDNYIYQILEKNNKVGTSKTLHIIKKGSYLGTFSIKEKKNEMKE